MMTEIKANKVYDILVSLGNANEDDRDNFVYNHTTSGCSEWRFIGNLGFGGKYRSGHNAVDCYPEDFNRERIKIIQHINTELSKI